MEITMWYGQLDHISPVISPGLNIQCATDNTVRALAYGVVAHVTSSRVYINFRYNGIYKQAVYGNITTPLTIGDMVQQGEVIGQMQTHMGKYVLELILRESTDNTPVGHNNYRRVNPAPFFDLSGIVDNIDFLSRPMANFFTRNAEYAGITATNYDIRYAHNLDLEEDGVYLRRMVEITFYSENLARHGYTMDNIIQWNDDDTITVAFFDEIYLFIPPDMCAEEALFNHHMRTGFMSISGFELEMYEYFNPHFDGGSLITPFHYFSHIIIYYLVDIELNRRSVAGKGGDKAAAINPEISSLVLCGNVSGHVGDPHEDFLNLLNQLTRDDLRIRSSGFLGNRVDAIVIDVARGGDELSYGTSLIRSAINSEHTITIQPYTRSSHVRLSPSDMDNASTSGVGSGSIILFNRRVTYYTIVADFDEWDLSWEGVYTRIEPIPKYIELGHELIHALRMSVGHFIPREVEGSYSFRHPRGWVQWRESEVEEFETQGMAYSLVRYGETILPNRWPLSENALRREHGHSTRITRWWAESYNALLNMPESE